MQKGVSYTAKLLYLSQNYHWQPPVHNSCEMQSNQSISAGDWRSEVNKSGTESHVVLLSEPFNHRDSPSQSQTVQMITQPSLLLNLLTEPLKRFCVEEKPECMIWRKTVRLQINIIPGFRVIRCKITGNLSVDIKPFFQMQHLKSTPGRINCARVFKCTQPCHE